MMLSSLGIIGGADGPTAILITSAKPDPLFWVLLGGILAAGAYLLLRRKRK